MPTTRFTILPTPIGPLVLAGPDERLACIGFPSGKGAVVPGPDWHRDDAAFAPARAQLQAYFDGRLTRFDLALAPRGTPFQHTVWRALTQIPPGETISYGELARSIGRPGASRAVGAANGANPLPIVVPCHRVIGAGGALTGFAGGLDTKRFLLALERGPGPAGRPASSETATTGQSADDSAPERPQSCHVREEARSAGNPAVPSTPAPACGPAPAADPDGVRALCASYFGRA